MPYNKDADEFYNPPSAAEQLSAKCFDKLHLELDQAVTTIFQGANIGSYSLDDIAELAKSLPAANALRSYYETQGMLAVTANYWIRRSISTATKNYIDRTEL